VGKAVGNQAILTADAYPVGMITPPHGTGLRLIAVFEAIKAALILATGLGLLALIHRDVEAVAVIIVQHLHINPASKYPRIFIHACGNLTDVRLLLLASLAMIDAVLRGFIAVGLWRKRRWGEWLGLCAASIYLPFEFYELAARLTWFRLAAIAVNVAIIVYLACAIRRNGG
jgi:uncharacterized membrane protein (DUF2068 family)